MILIFKALRIPITLILIFAISLHAETLVIGNCTAVATDSTITISVSAPLSGGSESGYQYGIYRSIQPNFIPAASSLLATVAKLNEQPYIDRKNLEPGTVFYYKVVGFDSAGTRVNAQPVQFGLVRPDTPIALSIMLKGQTLDLVYLGDSITAGAGLQSQAQAPPTICSECLRGFAGVRDVYFSNQGRGGHTTTDFLPGHDDFTAVQFAAHDLIRQHPGQLIFSVMLGTNDSANDTTNGAKLSASGYHANIKSIIDHLLNEFPDSRIFIHIAPWYSPNTHNGANYEESGLARLMTYFPELDIVIAEYARSAPGHVFAGDRLAFRYFSQNFLTDLNPEGGVNGTFFLHPNPKGAERLGALWALPIASRLESGWR